MNQERVEFGSLLRTQREARSLSITDVSRITKIPERTLVSLEEGSQDLPADVFVRGFLRSYCRCVGLDADETIRRYMDLPRAAPAVEYTFAEPGVPRRRPTTSSEARDAGASSPATAAATPPTVPADAPAEAAPDGTEEKPDDVSLLATALSGAGRGTGRVSLTLAVIILVIVATLTLSLLLRRPSHVGDGMTRLPAAGATRASA